MGYGLLKVTDGKAQMITMGVIDLRKFPDAYLKLGHIFERVTSIIDGFLPDEMAIEAPFFGKNVQSMLKLGRAQGTAIAAAIHHGVPIHEYAPMKIKMALTGNGGASKEQVAGMLQRLLKIADEDMGNSWMLLMLLLLHIVISFRWEGRRVLQSIMDGKILLERTRTRLAKERFL
jgi:crossover junction endodeoxyribonuclease RuvC